MEHDKMIGIIHLYADRNTAFHRGLFEAVEKKKWNQIAIFFLSLQILSLRSEKCKVSP